MAMLKFPLSRESPEASNITTKYIVAAEDITFDNAQLIPIDCEGRPIPIASTCNLTVNELGKRLLKATAEGDAAVTKELLGQGALFTADWLGTSPLHMAARHNHLEVCEILLRAGICKDARTKVDKTALHMAAFHGHTAIVEKLLEFGADIDCRDLLGMTPLHWAAQNGHAHVARVLVENFAERSPLSKFDLTPADIAAQIKRLDIVDIINEGIGEPLVATQHLSLQMDTETKEESMFDEGDVMDSISNSSIPLETILLEGSENSVDPETLNLHAADDDEQGTGEITVDQSSYDESMRLLQAHGITMLPHEDNTILNTVMATGHSVVLTDVGKQLLKSFKEAEQYEAEAFVRAVPKTKIITVSSEELVPKATINGAKSKPNILRQINGRLVPKNAKRVVMKKSKIVPVSNVSNIGNKNDIYFLNAKELRPLLLEAYKHIEECNLKLLHSQQETESLRQEVRLLKNKR